MSLSDRLRDGRNIAIGLAALAATGPAMNASEAAFNRFFYGNDSKIEYVANAEAGEAEASTSKWQYAKMGGKIPTKEEITSLGYACTNCDKPKEESFFKDRPEVKTMTLTFRKGNHAIALRQVNGISYSIVEGDLATKERIWCYAYSPNNIITDVSTDMSKSFQIDLNGYLTR